MATQQQKAAYYGFVAAFYLFLFREAFASYLPFLRYVDELFAALALPLWLLRMEAVGVAVRRRGYALLCGGLAAVGLLGGVIWRYQPLVSVALPELFLYLKFWLALYTGGWLFRHLNIQRYARGLCWHVRVVIGLYAALLVADCAFDLFDSSYRFGLRATELFYGSPTVFAASCVFVLAVWAAASPYVEHSGWDGLVLLALLCSSLRWKAFLAAAVFLYLLYLVRRKGRGLQGRDLLRLTPVLAGAAVWPVYYYYFSEIQADSARYQLLITSCKIAREHFPLGAGFGTFGSAYSVRRYSPLYARYGLQGVNGLREGAASFATDSFWPMVLAETGVLGVAIMVWLLVRLYGQCRQLLTSPGLYLAAMFIFCYELLCTAAEAAFVHPCAVPLALLLGALFRQGEQNEA